MMRRFGFLILFFLSLLNVWAVTTVQTQVSANQVTLNEPFVYAIIVVAEDAKDTPKVTPPKFPENLPFTVLNPNASPSIQFKREQSFDNWKRTEINQTILIFQYQFKPKFEGQHQIPSLELMVDGEKFQTDPITITVGKADTSAGNSAKLTAKFSSEQAMLGYMVTLSYDLIFPDRLALRYPPEIRLPHDFLSEHFTQQGEPTQEIRQDILNGITCRVIHLELQLIPKHEGTITLPSAVMTYQIPDQQRSRRRHGFPGSFLDDDLIDDFLGGNPLGMGRNYKTITVACDEITLEVQPLPTEGQPTDFTGIVGQLRVKANISTSEATVGEPVLLDLALSGAPNLADAKLPDFAKIPELANHFKVSGDDPALEKDGQTVFQRTLRATTPGDLTIPPIPFSYFDPKAREYRTATTQPIPIKVTAARQITLEDAQGAAPTAAQPSVTTINIRSNSGLEPDFSKEELWYTGPRVAPFSKRLHFFVPLLCLAIPPAFWLVCAMFVLLSRRRNATGAARAVKGAKGVLLRTIEHLNDSDPQCGAKFSTALQTFFATRFKLPPGAVTYADAEAAALRNGFTSDQIAPFRQIFADCEAAQYAAVTFDLTAAKAHLKDAIKPF
ncbi:MAG: BatD family protein [Victivallales bacterium]|nr:BatD family protein [Victivallales bacterium]